MPKTAKDALPQIVLLAGGQGTRLKKRFPNVAKPLVTVGGKPIIMWQIAEFRNHGFTNFLFLLCSRADQIKDSMEKIKLPHERYSYIVEEEPLGTGGALINAMPKLEKEFILLFADMVFTLDNYMNSYRKHNFAGKTTISLHINDHMTDSDKYELVDSLAICSGSETGETVQNRFANAGIYFFNKMDLLPWAKKKAMKLDLEKDIINFLARDNQLYGHHLIDYLRDLGTETRIKRFETELVQGAIKASRNHFKKMVRVTFEEYLALGDANRDLREQTFDPIEIIECGRYSTQQIYEGIQKVGIVPFSLVE